MRDLEGDKRSMVWVAMLSWCPMRVGPHRRCLLSLSYTSYAAPCTPCLLSLRAKLCAPNGAQGLGAQDGCVEYMGTLGMGVQEAQKA